MVITHLILNDMLKLKSEMEYVGTCKFMYESTAIRMPLYSIPHLSLTMTGSPVSLVKNGFGLT